MAYATGKKSHAISDRSGMAFPYQEMVREWTGALVHISEFEPKHPQIRRKTVKADAIALRNARPQDFNLLSGGSRFTTADLSLPGEFAFDSSGMTPADPALQNRKRNLNSFIGQVNIIGADADVIVNTASVSGNISTNDVTIVTTALTTYTVTVPAGIGGGFYIDGVQKPTLSFTIGNTYRFDQSDASNGAHPLLFSETSNGTHGGGSEYTTGVTKVGSPGNPGAYIEIAVTGSTTNPLYYYCQNHSGMGGQINIS
jgi:hypothetical protein